jgi:hypothetical protein
MVTPSTSLSLELDHITSRLCEFVHSPCEAKIIQGQIKDRRSDGANMELYLPPRAPPPRHVAQLLQMTFLYAPVKHSLLCCRLGSTLYFLQSAVYRHHFYTYMEN